MLKNYFKTAFRNLLKSKFYTLINTVGLAIGLAICVVIFLYIEDELSYDRFHPDADKLYRVVSEMNFNGDITHTVVTSLPLADYMREKLPEVTGVVDYNTFGNPLRVKRRDRSFFVDSYLFASREFFTLLGFNLIQGDPSTALAEPYTIVLTEATATKLFDKEDAVGKMVEVNWLDTSALFKVTGIAAEPPANSTIQYDAVCSFITHKQTTGKHQADNWLNISSQAIVKLQSPEKMAALNEKLPDIVVKEANAGDLVFYKPYLQPVTDIHLNRSDLGVGGNSSMDTIYLYTALALLILAIAAFNYMNLATARSAGRLKEVGMRKTLGAQRGELIRQFLAEAALHTLIAAALSIAVIEFLLPYFNSIFYKELNFDLFDSTNILLGFVIIIAVTGLGAGAYPAFYLSRFQAVKLFRSGTSKGKGSAGFRSVLVVAQFSISLVLIISTIIISGQISFMSDKNIGFDKEHVISIHFRQPSVSKKIWTLKKEIDGTPGVINASAGFDMPGSGSSRQGFKIAGQDKSEFKMSEVRVVDEDLADVLKFKMKEGRFFSGDFKTDEQAYVVNEEFVETFGLKNPVGAVIERNDISGEIIGVVENFNYKPLHQAIEPLVLYMPKENVPFWFYVYNSLYVRLPGKNLTETLDRVKQSWDNIFPEKPFNFTFMDERVERLYRAEQRTQEIFSIFALLGIFIACLGLLGLASFTAEARKKEIGIRKVLGATAGDISFLLSRNYFVLILVSLLIAAPVTYYFMNKWLQDFAYRIDITVWPFIIASLIVLLLALITVSYQSIRAAFANPVKTIRYE